jgi:glycosyltransferase involved in cell wall biosynthesis
MKIKVLHVIPHLGIGGCEFHLLEFCRRLDKERFNPSLIWYSFPPEHREASFLMEKDFIKAGVETLFIDKFSMSGFSFFRDLCKAIRQTAPDIVHTWLYSGNFWGRGAALACGVPNIIASYRDELRQNKLIIKSYIPEKLFSLKSILLANSSAVASSITNNFGISSHKIHIIHNAISSNTCDSKNAKILIRNRLNIPSDHYIIIMVANQRPVKNYPMFLRVAQQVCKQNSRVVFVSIGLTDMSTELNSLAAKLGVSSKVIFAGQQHDVCQWLAAADIFSFTSYSEGFPNALLEAMAMGLPSVVTNFNSASELINNNETGIIVPADDDKAMAEQIIKLLVNHELRSRLGAAGKVYIENYFTWSILMDKMSLLYSELVLKKLK